jgi:hypothetical protein
VVSVVAVVLELCQSCCSMLVGERSVMSGEGRKEVWLGDEDVGREGALARDLRSIPVAHRHSCLHLARYKGAK